MYFGKNLQFITRILSFFCPVVKAYGNQNARNNQKDLASSIFKVFAVDVSFPNFIQNTSHSYFLCRFTWRLNSCLTHFADHELTHGETIELSKLINIAGPAQNIPYSLGRITYCFILPLSYLKTKSAFLVCQAYPYTYQIASF